MLGGWAPTQTIGIEALGKIVFWHPLKKAARSSGHAKAPDISAEGFRGAGYAIANSDSTWKLATTFGCNSPRISAKVSGVNIPDL